jgi:glycosyltransferase involved in cell wall biosynthesis
VCGNNFSTIITYIELILVNDGSPDKYGEICDEYVNNDIRIKVIHKDNGGLSSALFG